MDVGLAPLLIPLPILEVVIGVGFFFRDILRYGNGRRRCAGDLFPPERFPVDDWGGYAGR